MNIQTVSIDSVSPEISEPNRRMCVLTLSDTDHHHTHSVYIHVYVKGTVESVEIQQRKKRETNTQKRYGNKSMTISTPRYVNWRLKRVQYTSLNCIPP